MDVGPKIYVHFSDINNKINSLKHFYIPQKRDTTIKFPEFWESYDLKAHV